MKLIFIFLRVVICILLSAILIFAFAPVKSDPIEDDDFDFDDNEYYILFEDL